MWCVGRKKEKRKDKNEGQGAGRGDTTETREGDEEHINKTIKDRNIRVNL